MPKIRRWDHHTVFDDKRQIKASYMALRPEGRYVLLEEHKAALEGHVPENPSIDWQKLALSAHALLVRVADTGLDDSCIDDVSDWLENKPPRGALEASRVAGAPVAWMYEHDGMVHDAANPPIITVTRWPSVNEPWNETPLFARRGTPA